MEQDLRTTLRACADLIRMDLALGAGAFLVAGEIVAYQGLPPLDEVVLGFASLFFIAGSANISNDYFDREVDRINLPSRPLPSGRITARGLWALFLLFSAAGLLAAALLSGPVLVLVAVFWAISVLYNFRLKEYGFFGNVVVATCLGMIFITGGLIANNISGIVVTFAALAFFFDLGEEIASDAMDLKGDEARPSQSLAKLWGKARAMQVAGIMYLAFFLVTLLPFLAGWFSYDYLLLVALMDLFMIHSSLILVRSGDIGEGRRQIRHLYLAWGFFVIVFAITRVL